MTDYITDYYYNYDCGSTSDKILLLCQSPHLTLKQFLAGADHMLTLDARRLTGDLVGD